MQRFIEFRGQDEDKNWHFGNYDKDNNEIFYTHIDSEGVHKVSIPIVPETVGQFANYFDKNGQKIYEGDIIQTDEKKRYFYTTNFYSANGFHFTHEKTISKTYNRCVGSHIPQPLFERDLLLKLDHYYVIGNIFDNPELLEE